MSQDSILSEKMHKFLFIVFGHVFLDIFSAFSKGVRLIFLLHSHHDMYSRKSQYQKVYKHINQKVYKKIVDHTTMQGGGLRGLGQRTDCQRSVLFRTVAI